MNRRFKTVGPTERQARVHEYTNRYSTITQTDIAQLHKQKQGEIRLSSDSTPC